MFNKMITKTKLILKIIATLALVQAAMNYNILLVLPKINYFFLIQYVGVALILVYFLSALSSVYTAFVNKNSAFVSIYIYIFSSCGLMSPVFSIPYSFMTPGLPQALFIFSFNILVLLLVVCIHIGFNREKRMKEKLIETT